jgi:bifunctional DNA-binding transcriptional regulator/antitoxin component of YhaV-PrlF toxin-antitoxin module
MQAIEFLTKIDADRQIKVPSAFAATLKAHQKVRIIILVEENEETTWKNGVAEQFLQGYADEDAQYDQL